MNPRVSVLLPVRNAARWLQPALDSLSRQSFREFEVVAVDDGSTDDSGDLLDAWAANDERFRVLHRPPEEPPPGLVPALDAGLARCRGEWVARMDADDVAHTLRLELQMRAVEEDPFLDVVSSHVRFFPCGVVERGMQLYEEWLNGLVTHEEILRERFVECPVPNPTVLVRRRVLDRVGPWRDAGSKCPEEPCADDSCCDQRWPEDYDLWLRMAAAGVRFAKVPRVLHFWREHPQRVTHTDPRYGKDRFLACKAHHLARGPLAPADRVVIWGAGPTGRRLTRELQRWKVEIDVFVDIDPAKVGRRVRGREVLAPEALPDRLQQPGRSVVLAAVAARGARELIRERLDGLGLGEGVDYWCVA